MPVRDVYKRQTPERAEKKEDKKMKIGIGNDHSALELKAEIVEFLKEKGHKVVDYGTNSSESCDYPI